MNIKNITPGENPPKKMNAIIEIPENGNVKYEMCERTGVLKVGRILHTPMVYPANYGFFPGTLGNDGDPLDCVVICGAPLMPGVLIAVRPIGILNVDDQSGGDEKVICVPLPETDPLYVERYYTPEMDKALRDMCDDIRAGYRDLISGAEWLSEPTRKELLKKLENIVYVTGSNLERHDNSKYANIYGNNYYEFRINYMRLGRKELIDSLNESVSRTDTQMPMQMFNACYDPSMNNITITVAITNKPFFDVNADYYTNLGGLGMVIAHEMGHAFDSTCIVFNADAEYDPSWIPDADMQILLERNEKAVRYFEDNFTVFGIYHVDGEQTLGENYADLGGLECVTSLCKTKEDRIKLFENYATIWCEMCTDDYIIDTIAYDSHSPNYIRVNAALGTVEAFYETYDVKEGDGMYIAPEDRISRWY